MGYYQRINNAFVCAPILPLTRSTKYALISDCHRGIGTWNDNFLKNRHLYLAALQYYYQNGFTYIELGDGDELWENRKPEQIVSMHEDVFSLLSLYFKAKRLYMIYGNHDMIKKKWKLFDDMTFYEGIILSSKSLPSIYLTHGHQASLLNSTFWRLSRFMVRYLWTPLERYGVLDPTSAAKNNTVKNKTEKKLSLWAESEHRILMTGHTHRPMMGSNSSPYFNTGSCIHPSYITCIEICGERITLVRWSISTRKDYSLYVSRDVMEQGFLTEFTDFY